MGVWSGITHTAGSLVKNTINGELDISNRTVNTRLVENNINGKFDVIVSNPPYISRNEVIMDSVKKYEPNIALYADNEGLYFYEIIIKNAKKFLNDKFLIAFEIGWWQGNLIYDIAKSYFNDSVIKIEKDLTGRDRYLFIINE